MEKVSSISQFFHIIQIYLPFLKQIFFLMNLSLQIVLAIHLFPKNRLYHRINIEFYRQIEERCICK